MTNVPHIRILMCTYNGGVFLEPQLQSFADQTHKDLSLWISDDGSTDDSLKVIERFRAAHPSIQVRIFDGPQMGVFANYMSLIRRTDADPKSLYAFSDQDDVWLEDKLERAVAALAPCGATPAAYATAQTMTDAHLRHGLPSRPCPRPPSFRNALVQNVLSGNTLVLNSGALITVQQHAAVASLPFHDWWIYLLLSGVGANIVYDHRPSILYRQHASNAIGGNTGLRAGLRRAVLLGGNEYQRWMEQNLKALQDVAGAFTLEHQEVLRRFVASRDGSAWSRLRAFRKLGLHRQSPMQTRALEFAAFMGYI